MQNTVSIIMPCLNSERTISQAIESILAQDHKYFELIIINDGSSDNSLSIIKKYQNKDSRIKLITNTGQHGVSFARNIGINAATGRYICFLDSDDYLLPESISARLQTAQKNSAKIVYGPYIRLYADGSTAINNVPATISVQDMLKRNFIGNLTGMYDAEFLGKLPQEHVRHEDYLMWYQLLKKTKFALSTGRNPIAVYRVSSNSLSGNKLKSFTWHWDILTKHLKINLFLAAYYQLHYLAISLIDRLNHIIKKTINEILYY